MYYLPENVNSKCGIYRIKNLRNGKFYIGSTKDADDRKLSHFRSLKKGNHHCDYLQNAWNSEDDKSVFEFQMFIYCKESMLIPIEQGCIDAMAPQYNSSKIAGRPELNQEARKKISVKLTGRIGIWKGVTGPSHPSFGRTDQSGEKNNNYGRIGSMRGRKGPDHPMFGKPGTLKNKKGPNHPAYGKTGAWAGVTGEDHPTSKLSQKQADEIRGLLKEKKFTQKEIGKLYGIGVDLVRAIKYNKGYVLKEQNNGG